MTEKGGQKTELRGKKATRAQRADIIQSSGFFEFDGGRSI